MTAAGRNDPCPCGSGKKFKKCCLLNDSESASATSNALPRRQGNFKEAKRLFEMANNLAILGKSAEAIAHYEQALELHPDFPDAHNNLGVVLVSLDKTDEAITHYEQAIAQRPRFADAHNNLGVALVSQGQLDRSVAHYERAISLNPEFADAYNNLSLALSSQGKPDRAAACSRRALALKPDYAEAHNNLGIALAAKGEINDAMKHYLRAIALRPNFPNVHNNLAVALVSQGRIPQAISHYQQALALKPDYVNAHSGLLFTLNYSASHDAAAIHRAHVEFAKRWEAPLASRIEPLSPDRTPHRRLRIGYVSACFRRHSVAYFIEPVLAQHHRDRFEIYCYHNNPNEDEVTQRLKAHTDHWRNIVGLPDEQVARQVREDRIDILVDLDGHTANNRLLVFARKPAPVQVAWIGYPNTTGLSTMDYRLTDDFADPAGMTERYHSEKLVRLPECFSCYQPPKEAPEVVELPALKKGYITFGSFNYTGKITPEVIAAWARILQTVPHSRLVLKNSGLGEPDMQQMIQQAFAKLGVAPERLELRGQDRSLSDHLTRYGDIDIGLDPFPYNGTTTTCEALWMGVPVVVLEGNTHAGRVGVSLMTNLGLPEFIGHGVEEYIAVAVRWATDLERLAGVRLGLRARMAASPLIDAKGFTGNLEQAYLTMMVSAGSAQ